MADDNLGILVERGEESHQSLYGELQYAWPSAFQGFAAGCFPAKLGNAQGTKTTLRLLPHGRYMSESQRKTSGAL